MSRSVLDRIEISSPCRASWDAMSGDDRVRFCGDCRKHVYDLTVMTRTEGEELLARTEGNACVRLYQREDGTVVTRDCASSRSPSWARVGARLAAALGVAATTLLSSPASAAYSEPKKDAPPPSTTVSPPHKHRHLMGKARISPREEDRASNSAPHHPSAK